MSDEIEYIEPTQEHIGQMVEVADLPFDKWYRYELLAILPDIYPCRYLCHYPGYQSQVRGWPRARIPRPLTYAERQAKCGLKVGDKVRFARKWEGDYLGTCITFCADMAKQIGNTGYISDELSTGLRVTFGAYTSWWLPYFVLEKVQDREATINDIGKDVYVDGAPSDVFGLEVVYSTRGDYQRGVVVKNDKRFVYELSNLRVKE